MEGSMKIKEIMTNKVISVSPEESAAVAARLFSRYNIGALPVCGREGKLRGMITDRDVVLRCVAAEEDPAHTKVSEIMTRRVISVDAEDTAQSAMDLMGREQIRRLPVEQNGKLVGMVSLGDFAKLKDCDAGTALSEISGNVRNF